MSVLIFISIKCDCSPEESDTPFEFDLDRFDGGTVLNLFHQAPSLEQLLLADIGPYILQTSLTSVTAIMTRIYPHPTSFTNGDLSNFRLRRPGSEDVAISRDPSTFSEGTWSLQTGLPTS